MGIWELTMKKKKYLLIVAAVLILLLSTSSTLAVVESYTFFYEPPSPPYGPTEGEVYIPYTFCIDLPNDVECEPYFVIWDFGDDYITEWSGPYIAGETVCEMHSWSNPGDYEIKVGIQDGCQNEYWTDPLIIHITENKTPSKPLISGPTHGRVGVEYKWTFLSTDPEGENITYYIDWGDYCGSSEWNGPHPSGEEVQIAHTYYYLNNFTFSSFAADEHGKESDWTGFNITITRSKTINLFIQLILERYLNAFPMIRNLLKL
jgi:hypothetical protein